MKLSDWREQMKSAFWSICGVIGGILTSRTAIAQTRLLAPKESFESPRWRALGGISSVFSDDGDAIFGNPGGIGDEDGDKSKNFLRGASFPNVTLGINKYTRELYKAYSNGAETRDQKVEQGIRTSQNKEVLYGRFTAFPYVTLKRFQLGVLIDTVGQGYLHNIEPAEASEYSTVQAPKSVTSKMKISSQSQIAIVSGFSIPYKNTGISFGVTVRYASRASLYKDVEMNEEVAADSAKAASRAVNKTRGLGVDLGLLYRSTNSWRPSAALVVHDLANSRYKALNSKYENEHEKTNVVLGFSVMPINGRIFGTTAAFEAHHLTDTRVTFADKMRIGLEFALGPTDGHAPVSVRVGHNLVAPSFGLAADLVFLKVDLSSFGEPIEGPTGRRIDTRYLMRFLVDLRA